MPLEVDLKNNPRNGKSYAGATGGGPPKVIKLTEVEENLLAIVDPEAVGLDNIPEEGNFYNPMQKRPVHNNDTIPQISLICMEDQHVKQLHK
ncbi:fis family transcriptional regulator [Lasius niger]|uniref:Fis family transcriptional regulator n=1 Tax=Lasius niger TaxID=67767 RepID=A0A0J7N4Q8_LASNI|nr:fis family transcriptional regulator [Lasius niger]